MSINSKKMRIAISGAGRIGRAVFRAYFQHRDWYPHLDLVALNDPHDFNTLVHLLRYDSVHGRFPMAMTLDTERNELEVAGERLALLASRQPEDLPWKALSVDTVLECTGVFKDREGLGRHLTAGAQRVVLSAPAKKPVDATIVLGANEQQYSGQERILSIGSCTTNALAPTLKLLQSFAPIENCMFTTVHAYTKDQSLVDAHHQDLRRARAAAHSIIPTKTGAAKAIGLVLPELSGCVEGYALRVPTANVSLLDMVIRFASPITQERLEHFLVDATKKSSYVTMADASLVSCDFNQHPASAVIDMQQTQVTGQHTARIVAWYDNEWAYSCRMLDMAQIMAASQQSVVASCVQEKEV